MNYLKMCNEKIKAFDISDNITGIGLVIYLQTWKIASNPQTNIEVCVVLQPIHKDMGLMAQDHAWK